MMANIIVCRWLGLLYSGLLMPLMAPCGDDGCQACACSLHLTYHPYFINVLLCSNTCIYHKQCLNDYCLWQTPAVMMTRYHVSFFAKPGGTFYLAMYVMICARATFRSLIWLLDFLRWNIEIHICTWKNWKISESCTRSGSLMLHLWFNVDPCGDDWGCQVSSAINIIFPALKRTQHLFC